MKILISDPMSEEGVKILQNERSFRVDIKPKLPPDELKRIIKDYDAILIRSGTKLTGDIIRASNLKIIGRAGVGLDNVDLGAATKKGVIVVNAPAGNTISTAEHTVSLLMALSRNITQANKSLKAGEWNRKKFMGVELYGKTLGIIGLGRIGGEVAARANSFKMNIVAYDPYLSVDMAKKMKVELVDLEELFRVSDYITVHTPITDKTKHMISDKEFKMMKYGVRLVNVARGGIIDETALFKALESGKVAGAALDVFEKEPPTDSPLLKLDNVIVTPHLGASTEEAQVNVAIDICETVRDALLDKGLRNAVNMPSLDAEEFKAIKPYINLAEKIGSMHAQLITGHIKQVDVRYIGDIANVKVEPITAALIKGMLSPILQETVNYVNAPLIAKDRGMRIVESKAGEMEDFASLIWVRVKSDKASNAITGTLFIKSEPRIVKINNFYVEAIPEGCMLVIYNKDVPGIIGQIGTLLGRSKINIAGMSFGREKPGQSSITVLNVDCELPKKVLEEIRAAKNIIDVTMIKL
ncbi:MAG: phosphoglycerate dehydrogenase [Candidatus Omnitrophica bacterium]|nr:phosphoglycerate dehydrogenase [Candidatus Omnitrophota bacterium]